VPRSGTPERAGNVGPNARIASTQNVAPGSKPSSDQMMRRFCRVGFQPAVLLRHAGWWAEAHPTLVASWREQNSHALQICAPLTMRFCAIGKCDVDVGPQHKVRLKCAHFKSAGVRVGGVR